MFDNFWGNPHVTAALEQMVAQDRLAQTLLFAGPGASAKLPLRGGLAHACCRIRLRSSRTI